MDRPASTGEVISIGVRGKYRPDYKQLACSQVAAARRKLAMSAADFAAYLGDQLGWRGAAETVNRWEGDATPPGDVILACEAITQGTADAGPAAPLLMAVPPSFPAGTLAGPWVTSYQFSHAGEPRCHADIAHVTAGPDDRIRAVNHPPEPRSEGRGRSFRNEIGARLVGRHLIGEWMNISDTRYYGTLQLAVLPGETVMEGYYTGVGSDVEVSNGPWRWVRLDPGSDTELGGITLREPSAVYDAVMAHSQYGEPLTPADVRGDL